MRLPHPSALLLISLLAALFLGAVPAASAGPVTTSLYGPLAGTVVGTADTVDLAGSVHVVVHAQPQDPMHLHVNLVGVEGVGRTTGLRYLGLGAASLEFAVPTDPIVPIELTFVMMPVGSQGQPADPIIPNDPIRVLLTLQFNPDTGELIGATAEASTALPGD